jgi:hypothetical protein
MRHLICCADLVVGPATCADRVRPVHTTNAPTTAGARPNKPGSPAASNWLGIALIVWLGGVAAGLALLPNPTAGPAGRAKPPATFPIDIQVPTAHDLPAVA